ncbi:MAG: Zn-dependent oligopeptidase, partial [Methanobacteriota archaeon]
MPASRATAEGDRRPDASPLTAPRYLFASDAESLAKEAAAGLAECRQRLEEILARGRPRTIENLLVPYDRLLSGLSELQGQSRFLFDVHPDAAVRETADKWYQEAERFATDLALNRPLYDAFVDLDVSQEDPETKYAVRKILRDFRLAGVDRDAATRERIKGLRDEMTATGQDFDRTIREDERSIQVDGAADLAGLPAD